MSWNKIDELLQKINEFYKKAIGINLLKTAQSFDDEDEDDPAAKWLKEQEKKQKKPIEPIVEEPAIVEKKPEAFDKIGLYPDIISFAKDVSIPEISEQLNKIAAFYKEAIETNKGYSKVSSSISNFIENTLPDYYSSFNSEPDPEPGDDITPEQAGKIEGQNLEALMNSVYADNNKRFINQRNIEKGLVFPQIRPEIESAEEIPFNSIYNDTEDPKDKPGLGTGINIGDIAGATAGFTTTNIPTYKDYVKSYEDEKNRLTEELKDVHDNKHREFIQTLIKVLNELQINAAKIESILKDGGISWTVYPATETSPRKKEIDQLDKRAEYEELKAEQKQLRYLKDYIKSRIRNYSLNRKNIELDNKINSTRNENYKFLLEQKKLLNNLNSKIAFNKAPEREARLKFIKILEGGATPQQYESYPERLPTLNNNLKEKYLAEINEAANKKISAEEYRKRYIEKKRSLFEYSDTGRRINSKNLEAMIELFTSSLSSIKMGVKKAITDKLRKNKDLKYKVYLDAIESAKIAGDQIKEKEATKTLANIINADTELTPEVQSIIKYREPFYEFIKELKLITKSENKSSNKINELNIIANKLLETEKNRRINIGGNKASNLETALIGIIPELKSMSEQFQTKQSWYNMNFKKRSAAIKNIIKEAQQDKTIDDIMKKLESIQDPKEYADKIFEELLSNLDIKGLED